MEKKIILKSNFCDYYDAWFDIKISPEESVYTLERFTYGGMSRFEMLNTMKSWGLTVPEFGICNTMRYSKYYEDPRDEVVVYTEPTKHCGEGKIKIPLIQAKKIYPNQLCARFIKHNVEGYKGYTKRILFLGTKIFDLEYASKDDWRSNCGNVEVKLIKEISEQRGDLFKNHPICALDTIPTDDNTYAVDFNIAPQVWGTGIEEQYSGREIANMIREFINKYLLV